MVSRRSNAFRDLLLTSPDCDLRIRGKNRGRRCKAECSLRIEGYETVAAATRKDALAVLRSDQEVDVLFTDINLRGEKRAGLELAEKAVELRPDLAVLYTTGGDV
jgi:CheY-like chemotaxis protein